MVIFQANIMSETSFWIIGFQTLSVNGQLCK